MFTGWPANLAKMTKSFEKISIESLHGVDYSSSALKSSPVELTEPPVLDLSCKKSLLSPSSPPILSYAKEPPMLSPLRGSSYLAAHQEANNNDNKHISGYHLHQQQPQQQLSPPKATETHHYEQPDFSSSNHERKSPFQSPRSYIMTPPSESDSSPKKSRFTPVYEHASIISETTTPVQAPAFSMLPMSLPVPIPMGVPSPVQLPTPASPMQIPSSTGSSSHESMQTTVSTVDESKKAPRPFKAYPKDPMSITLGPDMMYDQELKKAYTDFRSRMLDSVKRTNEGTNIKMRRISKSPMLPTSTMDEKDSAYWERRRKNNEAAKRSRDARRAKEDEIAIRAAFLEQEYIRLKYENALLKNENTKFRCMLFGH